MNGVKEMVAAAKAGIESLSPDEVAKELRDGDVLLVDVREPTETAGGVLPGDVLAPRGMLEFHADPSTPYHLKGFDTSRRVILYCAAGSRSALGAVALQNLGSGDVAHLDGGYGAGVDRGHPVHAAPAT